MLAAARRDSDVLSQDGCPLFRWHQRQVNAASASVTDNSIAVCSFDILHPVRLQTEHRYEIALPIHRGNDHGIRVYAAGLVHLNFKNGLKSGRQA